MKFTLALLALMIPSAVSAAAPAKAPAPAGPTPTPTTAACILVSNAFAKHATEEKDRTVAQSVLYFFIGRIDDRMTSEQLKSALAREGALINEGNAGPLMNACLRQMQTKAQMLQNTAQQLQKPK